MATSNETTNESPAMRRPSFLDAISEAYSDKGKGVVVLTGNTHDVYWCEKQKKFLPLEQLLYQEWSDKFTFVRVDAATGIDVYDSGDMATLAQVCSEADSVVTDTVRKIGDLKSAVASTRHQPLPAIVLLREILEAGQSVVELRRAMKQLEIPEKNVADGASVAKEQKSDKPKSIKKLEPVKPVCTFVQFSGSLFPSGDFERLSELDRQRLVTFLNLLESPKFKASYHLIILVADTTAEVNSRIVAQPSVQCVEIGLPKTVERANFINKFAPARSADGLTQPLSFEKGLDDFVEATAGLTLTSQQVLLEAASRTGKQVSHKDLLAEINVVMQKDLGGIIRRSTSEHGSKDIVGYEETGNIIHKIFERCERPESAVSAIGVWGANGAGKTYQFEGYANDAGRVCIELGSIRGEYFGQTDALFEKLYLKLMNYGKVLIMVDEAATAFGSVHRSDTHETEKRLAGNIIKMMSDRSLRGKVLWALMTARPDELDPDIRRRCQIQVPIFDLEGDDRKKFVVEIFKRKGIEVPQTNVDEIMKRTEGYSADDYNQLVAEVNSTQAEILATLAAWRPAGLSIKKERRLQTVLAAYHCTYPALLPKEFKERSLEDIREEADKLKHELYGSAA